MIQRDDFLAMCEPLMAKLEKVLAEAFEGSGLTKEELASVEICGGSVRIPIVQQTITKYFGLECSKTQNFDECIAKGCALQSAMLSPAFKVRDFSVHDVTMYPIALSWSASAAGAEAMDVEGEEGEAKPKAGASSTVVFNKFNPVPNTKMLTFYRKDTFSLSAAYDSSVVLPSGFPSVLNEFTVCDIPLKPANEEGKVEPAKIKVKLRLDIHGCLELESAVAIEEIEQEEEAAPPAPAPARLSPRPPLRT